MNRFDLTTPYNFLYDGTRSIFSSRNIEYPSLKNEMKQTVDIKQRTIGLKDDGETKQRLVYAEGLFALHCVLLQMTQ